MSDPIKGLNQTGLARLIENVKANFARLTHTHTKSDITDFPIIPSKTSDLTNDSGFVTANDVASQSVTGVKGGAESTYRTGQVNITPQNIGALPTAGGILHGDYARQVVDVDASQSNNGVSSTHWAHIGLVYDNAGRALMGITPEINSDGNIVGLLYVRNYNTNGELLWQNHIMFGIDKAGQQTYAFSAPDKARNALSAAAANHSHTAAEVGAIPVTNELPEYVDLNSVQTSGFYRLPGNIQNGPPESVSYGQLIVSKNSDTSFQIAASYYETDKVFYRMGYGIGMSNQQYQSWQKLVYTLPAATANTLGGIKVSSGFLMYNDALYLSTVHRTHVSLATSTSIADNAQIVNIYTVAYRDPFMAILWTYSNSTYTPHILPLIDIIGGVYIFGFSSDSMNNANNAIADTVNGVHYSRVISHLRYNPGNGEIYINTVGKGYKGTSGNTSAAVPSYVDLYDFRG